MYNFIMEQELENVQLDKVRVNVWLTRGMYQQLDALSSDDGRSMSDFIRQALRNLIDQTVKQKKE
jgi:metal-responsive CopG/Arc/MetJ family transcriptional regulator